jgi:ABC-2 type transport system ATP-binding protein
VVAELRGRDAAALAAAALRYPHALDARREDDDVVVRLGDPDLGALNRFLAGQGIYVSHLGLRRRSLEEAFLEITSMEEGAAA